MSTQLLVFVMNWMVDNKLTFCLEKKKDNKLMVKLLNTQNCSTQLFLTTPFINF